MRHRDVISLIQPLEARLLWAATPASPRPDTMGAAFDATERRVLLDRLTGLSSATRSSLQAALGRGVGAFDSTLLAYMRSRSGPNFFFDPQEADDIGRFIVQHNLSYTDVQTHANAVTDSRRFPEQSSARTFDVQLPDSINWISPGGSDNPEFLHTLNRHDWWREMAWTHAITGDDKYLTELEYELASWSQQFPTMARPAAWSRSDQAGWLLDTSIRAESWSWAYFGFLQDAQFSPATNSLFMYKLIQTADFLNSNAVDTTDFSSNRSIVMGKGLLYIGTMFPEVDNSAAWKSNARSVLFNAMDRQICDDGSHVEQSPGYAFNVADDLLDARQLDRVNDTTWPASRRTKLANIVDSYWQFLHPDGTRPAIGDTYRNDARGVFLKPNIVLGTTRWPIAKPRPRDVFVLGTAATRPHVNAPAVPATLGQRGAAYAMADSGNFIMRSGGDASDRQLVFDAGPKGGPHGHFDLLSFELYGYGRPLISDPGAFRYDTSADRAYAISTAAHNTLNASGLNHAAIETSGSSDIIVSQFRTGADFAQVTATHRAYKDIAGSPVLTRSIWYDLDGTMVIVDWAEGSARHDYQQSFNLQTEGDTNNVTVDAANLTARTRYPSGGNVMIQGIRHNDGETAAKGPLTFVTNQVGGDFKDDAYRFRLNQSGKYVVFVTLVSAYSGRTPPDLTANIVGTIGDSGPIFVDLHRNGRSQRLEFARPLLQSLDGAASNRGNFNDVAFDRSNRLHLAYADRDSGALMYARRDTAGRWSTPAIIDPPVDSDADGSFQFVSIATDSAGNPAVAYFDGWNGDLRYASLNAQTGRWQGQIVESRGSTGLYPSLAFGRDDRAAISYYNRTDKDLQLARSTPSGFVISKVYTIGDVGRASNLVLDPNRSSITRWAVGYTDTTNGDYKYALEGDWGGGTQAHGFTSYLVHNLSDAGGYASLAFYDSGTAGNKRFKPAMSYYDSGETALWFAKNLDGGPTWERQVVASAGVQGLYNNLVLSPTGAPVIYYYDRTNNAAVRATLTGATWQREILRAGGRELHTTVDSAGRLSYSSLNERTGLLNVYNI